MRINFVLILITLFFLASCKREDDSQTPIWHDNGCGMIDSALYNTDKTSFVRQYLGMIQSKKWLIEEYPNVRLSDRFFVLVDTILYSKDRTFMIVFYGVGDKGSIKDGTPELYRLLHYSCTSAIGYRDSIRSSVTFFENNRLTVNSDNYRSAMNAVENYHLKHYKKEQTVATREKYGYIGYNVDDSLFFEESPLFQKYSDSLYYFQIDILKDRSYKNMPDSIILRKYF